MVNLVSNDSSSSQIEQQIGQLIGELKEDTSKGKVAHDLAQKKKELDDLLIELILANSDGQKDAIRQKIGEVEKSMQDEVQSVLKAEGDLKSIPNDPSQWNSQMLALLQQDKNAIDTAASVQ